MVGGTFALRNLARKIDKLYTSQAPLRLEPTPSFSIPKPVPVAVMRTQSAEE